MGEEQANKPTITPELIAAALERRKQQDATPLVHEDAEIGGAFIYRRLTGAEVREARSFATVPDGKGGEKIDRNKFEFALVNRASVEPKITSALWLQLGQLGPLVQAGLSAAVLKSNGLVGEPVEEAKNASSESQN
jgi:hypothetical protein